MAQPGGATGGSASAGLRVRKKERTRRAIQQAALDLFAERGYDATTVEAIAAEADVSTTTFFRYYGSKEDVVFADRTYRESVLGPAIADRPAGEGDMAAVRWAIENFWIGSVDQEIVAKQSRAAASSPALLGRGLEVSASFERVIADALAKRRGVSPDDPSCRMTAAVAVSVLGHAVSSWAQGDRSISLPDAISEAFDLLARSSREWSKQSSRTSVKAR
jgi:AcrR family transcriptional regulator